MMGAHDGSISIASIRCNNCNETFLDNKLLDHHASICEINELQAANERKNIKIKNEPDMDVRITQVKSEVFFGLNDGCFESIVEKTDTDSFASGKNIVEIDNVLDMKIVESQVKSEVSNNECFEFVGVKDEPGSHSDHDSVKSKDQNINDYTKCENCNNFSSTNSISLGANNVAVIINKSAFLLCKCKNSSLQEKRYKCTTCEYASNLSYDLKRHMLTHTQEKSLVCTMCDYATNQAYYLKKHMIKHSGLKAYKCIKCDYAATKANNLKVHMLRHAGKKRYKCSQCGYASVLLGTLKEHIHRHGGEKIFKCTICDYSAVQSSY